MEIFKLLVDSGPALKLNCKAVKWSFDLWSFWSKTKVHIQRNKWNHQSPLFIYIMMSFMSLWVMCMTSFVEDCIFHSINSFSVTILIGTRTSYIFFLVKENIKYKYSNLNNKRGVAESDGLPIIVKQILEMSLT